MAGANWTRKDYIAIADFVALEIEMAEMDMPAARRICSRAIMTCFENSKLTVNGTSNFDAEKFRKYVQEKSGISFYP